MINTQIVHDTIAELLGLPLNRVINAYSVGGRINDDHATLRYFEHKREVLPETRLLDSEGNAQVRLIWTATLEVQLFIQHGSAVELLRTMINQLDLYRIDNRFKSNDIVIVDVGPIRDLTTLLADKHWESRALVEIGIRFTDIIADKLDMIETVQIVGRTGDEPVDTGLIRKEEING